MNIKKSKKPVIIAGLSLSSGFFIFFLMIIIIIASIGGISNDNKASVGDWIGANGIMEAVYAEMEEYQKIYGEGKATAPAGAKYTRWIGISDGSQWCASFASYILSEKAHLFSQQTAHSSGFASVVNMYRYMLKRNDQFEYHAATYTPAKGDIVVWLAGSRGHIGFCEGDGKAGTGHFISGNWASSVKRGLIRDVINDGGIHKKLVGYFTPKYPDSLQGISVAYTGNNTAKAIWDYLRKVGFTKEAAAGILGNIQSESGFRNTDDNSSAGIDYGLFHMSGIRRRNYMNYCKVKYNDPYHVGGQMEYFLKVDFPNQLNTYTGGRIYYYNKGYEDTGKRAWCWWTEKYTLHQFMKIDEISSDNTSPDGDLRGVELATDLFMRVFERPSIPHLQKNRIPAAKGFLKIYGNQ